MNLTQAQIVWLLRTIIWKENIIMATIADLQVEVAKVKTVEASAVILLKGLSQQLKDALAANDPAAIQAVIDDLDTGTNDLAAAVTENTPTT